MFLLKIAGSQSARIYRPRKEILDGSWTFPAPQAVK